MVIKSKKIFNIYNFFLKLWTSKQPAGSVSAQCFFIDDCFFSFETGNGYLISFGLLSYYGHRIKT